MIENKVYHSDFLNNTLPDKCASLIIADPPYFEVKGEFDFIWKSFEDYLKDVERWAVECKRLLADNGTLFWWGNSKKIAYSQVIIDKYFNLENSLVWRKKDSIQYQYYSPDLARSFNTHNERLLMYSNEVDRSGLEIIMEDYIWAKNPFGLIIKESRAVNKVGRRIFAERILLNGYKNIDSAMAQISNWELGKNIPTIKDWLTISNILNIKTSYEQLKKEYEELRKEHECKRRFFYNPSKFEEVLEFSQEGHKTGAYDHDTVKPEKLTRALILTCSRPNDLVVVPFSGSGTECAMAVKEGRRAIGFDVTSKYVEMGNSRIKNILLQPELFKSA